MRALGAGFVTATGRVDQDLQGGLLPSLPGDVAQWNAVHKELQAIAWQGMSPRDARAVQDGVDEKTGRQVYPDTLSLLAGGLFGAIGVAARAPIRITPDSLDDAGRFLGQKNAGANAPLFSSWLSKAENLAEIMPGGQVRFTTRITDPDSSLNGRSVSVSCTEAVPHVSQLGVGQVDIPNPIGRGIGVDAKADIAGGLAGLCRPCRGSGMVTPRHCPAQPTAWLPSALAVHTVMPAKPYPKGRAGAGA